MLSNSITHGRSVALACCLNCGTRSPYRPQLDGSWLSGRGDSDDIESCGREDDNTTVASQGPGEW